MDEHYEVESPYTDLRLRRCEGFEDWWTIERAVHSGECRTDRLTDEYRTFLAHWTAARLGSGYTDIEGPAQEMREIAEAIKARLDVSFKRCAVEWLPNGALLWSPRNSRHPVLITHAQADALAQEIMRSVGDGR